MRNTIASKPGPGQINSQTLASGHYCMELTYCHAHKCKCVNRCLQELKTNAGSVWVLVLCHVTCVVALACGGCSAGKEPSHRMSSLSALNARVEVSKCAASVLAVASGMCEACSEGLRQQDLCSECNMENSDQVNVLMCLSMKIVTCCSHLVVL